jgi:hypothetical protein
MSTDTVKKILKMERISINELNEFVVQYVKHFKNIDISHEYLYGIVHLIQSGVFDLNYAAEQAARALGINLARVLNSNNQVIKVFFY